VPDPEPNIPNSPPGQEGYSKPVIEIRSPGSNLVTALRGVVEVMGFNHPAPALR